MLYADDMQTINTAMVSNPKATQFESTKRLFQTPKHQTIPLKIRMIKLGTLTDSPSSTPGYDIDDDEALDEVESVLNHRGKITHKRLGTIAKDAKPTIIKNPSF